MRNFLIITSLLFSLNLSAQNSCEPNIQGGPDVFPWNQAQPFPWAKIEGLWKVSGNPDLIFKLRVIRQTTRLKQLEIELFSKSKSCETPQMNGIGLITAYEKNVVRFNVDNKLIKLAVIKSEFIFTDVGQCGNEVMALSMIDLNSNFDSKFGESDIQYDADNMLLKKISSSLDLNCKRSN